MVHQTRRDFLQMFLAAPAAFLLAAAAKKNTVLPLTPKCDDPLTPSQTEGPYFKTNSPERKSFLESSISGTRLILSGMVLNTTCQVINNALVELWHADNEGNYDNKGFLLRGHQYTAKDGKYYFETIIPGLYPGRTRHYHLKVQAPHKPVLTTQLYFPEEPGNNKDMIFNKNLLLKMKDLSDGRSASFNFVIKT